MWSAALVDDEDEESPLLAATSSSSGEPSFVVGNGVPRSYYRQPSNTSVRTEPMRAGSRYPTRPTNVGRLSTSIRPVLRGGAVLKNAQTQHSPADYPASPGGYLAKSPECGLSVSCVSPPLSMTSSCWLNAPPCRGSPSPPGRLARHHSTAAAAGSSLEGGATTSGAGEYSPGQRMGVGGGGGGSLTRNPLMRLPPARPRMPVGPQRQSSAPSTKRFSLVDRAEDVAPPPPPSPVVGRSPSDDSSTGLVVHKKDISTDDQSTRESNTPDHQKRRRGVHAAVHIELKPLLSVRVPPRGVEGSQAAACEVTYSSASSPAREDTSTTTTALAFRSRGGSSNNDSPKKANNTCVSGRKGSLGSTAGGQQSKQSRDLFRPTPMRFEDQPLADPEDTALGLTQGFPLGSLQGLTQSFPQGFHQGALQDPFDRRPQEFPHTRAPKQSASQRYNLLSPNNNVQPHPRTQLHPKLQLHQEEQQQQLQQQYQLELDQYQQHQLSTGAARERQGGDHGGARSSGAAAQQQHHQGGAPPLACSLPRPVVSHRWAEEERIYTEIRTKLGNSPSILSISELAFVNVSHQRVFLTDFCLSDLEKCRCIKINSGTFCSVYLAYYKDQEVAVKCPHQRLLAADRDMALYRALAEWQVLQQVNCAEIVSLIGGVVVDNCVLMVTELVRGGDLYHALYNQPTPPTSLRKQQQKSLETKKMLGGTASSNGPSSPPSGGSDRTGGQCAGVVDPRVSPHRIVLYMQQLADGLAHLHARRIAHKDIKCNNLLINRDQLKICDFGDAEILHNGQIALCTAATWQYVAPELVSAADPARPIGATELVDVWAMGCVFLELVRSPTPFFHLLEKLPEDLQRDRLRQFYVSGRLRREIRIPLNLPPRLEILISHCLQYDPVYRATARQIANHIQLQALDLEHDIDFLFNPQPPPAPPPLEAAGSGGGGGAPTPVLHQGNHRHHASSIPNSSRPQRRFTHRFRITSSQPGYQGPHR